MRVLLAALSAAADTCLSSMHMYNHTACTRNPFNETKSHGISQCCSFCAAEPRCAAFTFHSADLTAVAGCLMSEEKDTHQAAPSESITCGSKKPLSPSPSPSPSPSDWDVRMGYSTMQAGDVKKPGENSTDGQLQPLGKVSSWQTCEQRCAQDGTCISFDYHGAKDSFEQWCYKRINYQFPVVKRAGCIAGWKGGPAPGPPSPGAPTPAPANFMAEFSCAMRRLAYGYAKAATTATGGRANISQVYHSLAMQECNSSMEHELTNSKSSKSSKSSNNADGARVTSSSGSGDGSRVASAATYYISTTGSDANAGTSLSTAWATFSKAIEHLRSIPPETRPCTVINVEAGTYRLSQPLHFDESTSGASADCPVLVQAMGGTGEVIISGGRSLENYTWTPAIHPITGAKLLTTKLPSDWPTARVESMFIGGKRQIRARYPNGRPEEACYKFDHGKGGANCPGFMQAAGQTGTELLRKPSKSSKQTLVQNTVVNANVTFANGTNGQVFLFKGTMLPLDQNHTITVPAGPTVTDFDGIPPGFLAQRTKFWGHRKLSFQDYRAANVTGTITPGPKFGIERYDLSRNLPFWDTTVPSSMFYDPHQMSPRVRHWKNAGKGAIVHIYQSGYWGNWGFEVKAVDAEKASIAFSKGGFQEARGGTIGGTGTRGLRQDFYIENVYDELDVPGEFFYDSDTHTLSRVQAEGEAEGEVVLPVLENLITVAGSSSSSSARHITFRGLTLTHTLPTFMQPYEQGQGGDWAYHRGGAVFLENAEGLVVEQCHVTSAEGNAIFLSDHVADSIVRGNECNSVGDSCVVLAGSTALMDGRAPTQPVNNSIVHNHLHNFGIWGKQTSGVFHGVSRHNNISFNVIHDCPRAGINTNDGFGGGTVYQGNLLFNTVLDTGEHGTFNSWDRQPLIWRDDNGVDRYAPDYFRIQHNFVFRNSFVSNTANKFTLDKDDGSSGYLELNNVLVFGGIKDRDGFDRVQMGNLILFPEQPINGTAPSSPQVNGFFSGAFVNNTCVTTSGLIYGACGKFDAPSKTDDGYPSGGPDIRGNTFITPNVSGMPFSDGNCGGFTKVKSFSDWQQAGFDVGSKQQEMVPANVVDELTAKAKSLLLLEVPSFKTD